MSFTISWNLLKLMSIEPVMPPTISSSVILLLLAFNLSQHQGLFLCQLSQKVAKKTWSFSVSITPSNESVQFSRSAVSDSLWPHGLQHIRLPCPSPTLGVYSNSCSLSQWCYPTISFSVIPFSSCLQSLPVSGFFQWVSSLHQVAKALEFQLQHQSFQWTLRTDLEDGLVGSPCSPRDSLKSPLQHHSSKASIFWHTSLFIVQLSHPYMTTGLDGLDGPLLAK